MPRNEKKVRPHLSAPTAINKSQNITYWPRYDCSSEKPQASLFCSHTSGYNATLPLCPRGCENQEAGGERWAPVLPLGDRPHLPFKLPQALRQPKHLHSSSEGLARGLASPRTPRRAATVSAPWPHAGLQVLTRRLSAVISLERCFSSSDTYRTESKFSLKFNMTRCP